MAAQAAHTAVFELDRGAQMNNVPQSSAASELRQSVIYVHRMHPPRRNCNDAVVTALAIVGAQAQRRRKVVCGIKG